jgi:hypothetical protein
MMASIRVVQDEEEDEAGRCRSSRRRDLHALARLVVDEGVGEGTVVPAPHRITT